MRLSQANENCQRTSNHQPSPSKRPKTALGLKGRFPKTVRLRTRLEFQRVQREGRRFQGQHLVFTFKSENFSYPRLGITVSKQQGSAVARNRFKRLIREVFRREKHRLPQGLSLHVGTRSKIGLLTLQQIQADFKLLLDQFN